MTSAGRKKRRRAAAMAALLCALAASSTVGVGPAAAEEGDAAPIRSILDGFYLPQITSVAGFEEYPIEMELGAKQQLHQIDEHEIAVEYTSGHLAFMVTDPLAHDAVGAAVPTSIVVSGSDVVTILVHHRAGNPAGGGAPFAYPITEGEGWEGGLRPPILIAGPPDEAELRAAATAPTSPTSTVVPPPAPACTVPSLRGLSLHATKARLAAAGCSIGAVHLAPGATDGTGRVVKQFRAVGIQIPGGVPVAVKLGPR